jgi:ABC-type amino acid transport substrate-binding protein
MILPVRISRALIFLAPALAAFGVLLVERSRGAEDGAVEGGVTKVLTICAVQASMPRTGKAPDGTPEGVDIAVAKAVARVLGRKVEFHWCANPGCAWNCLPAGRCDVVAGQPQASGPAHDVAWSVAYAGAQFGLVVPRNITQIRTLADLRGKRVGIVTGTVAVSEKDHAVVRFRSREDLFDGFHTQELDAAFLDADFAAWYLHGHPQIALKLVPDFVPREHWNMALAVRATDAHLLVEINRALAQLAESGELRKIFDGAAVPFRPPFMGSEPRTEAPNTWKQIREKGELVVSFDPANLPYSAARGDRPGIDVEFARALASRLEVKLRIEWLDIQHETAVGQLLQQQCDLVFGEAVATNIVADDEELAGKISYSRPYYGTGYVLVERATGPNIRWLAELKGPRSERLGTEAGSVADYSLRQRGYLRRLFRNQLATLKALDDGDIDFAYLWMNVGWTLSVSRDLKLKLVPDYRPEDHWNIAVAMRRGDDELKRKIDTVLDVLINDGTVARIVSSYHLPYYAPFPEQANHAQTNGEDVIHHAVAERGPEPRMQKIQSSKHGYSTLARVNSAGELVVALDQNNLPFSSAHPDPSGLDYTIAGLLAEQLGVKLRVYWALSAHDSYPSKLASKGLCDVILGVMPDDRFEQRVLYSRPYYYATYQLVVPSRAQPPTSDEPLAVEDGVAVRGLKGRAVRAYPSTAAILEAVATRRERAGYVISTRGPSLARERWPGMLSFLPAMEPVDRFPICAAVRKTDGDLRAAIDKAWDRLDQSGQLARVFAHWHIPYESGADRETKSETRP